MNEIRSCMQCKYGPNFTRCQMGRTGKPRSPESLSLESNPFRPPSPTRYYLANPNQMPCFEPLVSRPQEKGKISVKEQQMKKGGLIVASVYMGLVILATFMFAPSPAHMLWEIGAQLPVAALLFLLVWGIGSLIRRRKQ